MAQVFLEMVQNILKSGNDEDPNPYVQVRWTALVAMHGAALLMCAYGVWHS